MVYLEVKNLVKKFGDFAAVNNLDLKVDKGEFITLLGSSGCGKTTTLRVIAGFENPTEGEIYLNKKNITETSAESRNMGMVFQSYALFPTMTVYENICFGLRVRKINNSEIRKKVNQLLELGHLEGLSNRYPAQLSGGQQQRVALLRALAIEPNVLLLDEPLSNLDAKLRVEIRKEIRRIQSKLNITTVYVTHDQEEALAISDKIAVMNNGVIQQCGTPIEIYMEPSNKFVSDFIGHSNFLSCVLKERNRLGFENEIYNLKVSEKFNINDKVFISFRPQYVKLYQARYKVSDNFKGITIQAKLSFEIFLGTLFQMEAVTKGGTVIIIEIPLEERKKVNLKVGDEVVLLVPFEHINVYSS